MDTEDFIEMVRCMRAAQKAYFKDGRKQSDLIESKRLEKQVDEALRQGVSIPVAGVLEETAGIGEGEQITMFEEEKGE
jgi:hypothetical protein